MHAVTASSFPIVGNVAYRSLAGWPTDSENTGECLVRFSLVCSKSQAISWKCIIVRMQVILRRWDCIEFRNGWVRTFTDPPCPLCRELFNLP